MAIPLDYEKDRSLQVIAVAVDNGQPQLTSTATVNVNIENVNDENPTFKQVNKNTRMKVSNQEKHTHNYL